MAGQSPSVMSMERKLTAILSADVKGYSRLMGADEEATVCTLTAYREVMTTLIQQHRGRVVDSPGDNLLAEFASVVDAVRCAVEIQRELKVRNAELPGHRQMEFRIGINVGDVVVEGERIYGDGVNIAARLESLAEAGGICIAGTVYDQVKNKLPLEYASLGEQVVKNIAEPVRVWRVGMDPSPSVPVSPSPASAGEGRGEGLPQAPPAGDTQTRRLATAHHAWVVGGVGGLLLIVGTIVAIRYLSPPPFRTPHSAFRTPEAKPPSLPLPDKPSIAVLPFTNMSSDPGQEYFSDGMSEALITDLSQLSGLFVIARNSVFTYKSKATKVQEVSRELGVRYVLEGSVQKADSRVRITAQLVDATTGGHLWAKSYDRELQSAKDIFVLQDEITQQIVAELQIEVAEAERERVRRIPTDNLTAYDSLLRGVEYLSRFTREAIAQARQLFEHALELDPQYAEAYVALGWTYFLEHAWWSFAPQDLERASALAQKAVRLDDSLPAAHDLLGYVYLVKGQPELALAENERALALDPNDADGYFHQAEMLTHVRRPAEAIELVEKAMRLNPHYPAWYPVILGRAYRLTGRYEEAITAQKQALVRNPDLPAAHLELAESHPAQWESLQTQDPQVLERALESAQKAVALSESHPEAHKLLARVYLWKKQHEQAIAEAERTIALVPNDADSHELLAAILSFAGQPEKAIEVGERALRLNPHPPAWYFLDLGRAYALTRRYEEAIAAFKNALARDPQSSVARLSLAAVYSELGREEEAQAEMAEFRKLSPKVSLAVLQPLLVKDPAIVERVLATLRKAGLE